ncbi:MAG: nucleotidyltransferase domain-containing protein [Candidatus Marinimicrobia bacterium]|nr:nucleotidyltransferase domain-containing protein [Candidatus Neomarinimicrobiota bacterium]
MDKKASAGPPKAGGQAGITMTDISQIIKSIAKIVQEELSNNYKLFLFGSRVKDTCDEKADIDIGILGDGKLSAMQMLSIKDKIEEIPTLLKIDFVDFAAVGDDFRAVALKQVVEITS